jgi:hypothetical protein
MRGLLREPAAMLSVACPEPMSGAWSGMDVLSRASSPAASSQGKAVPLEPIDRCPIGPTVGLNRRRPEGYLLVRTPESLLLCLMPLALSDCSRFD